MVNKVRESLSLPFLVAGAVVFSAHSCQSIKPTLLTNINTAKEATRNAESPRGEVASYKVQIEIHEGKCMLLYDGPQKGQLETGLTAPCAFSREHNGGIQHIVQERLGKKNPSYTVMLIIGGPADPKRSDKYMKDGCGTLTQPVSLSPRGVALGSVEGGLTVCPSEDLDRPMFRFSAKPV